MPSASLPRWIGLLPIAFLAWTVAGYCIDGCPDEALWMCNVSNGLLGLGILIRSPRLIWVAALWILPGTLAWLVDATLVNGFRPHSFFTHFASAGIGLAAMRGQVPSGPVWGWAWLLALVMQLISRLVGDPGRNVNLVFSVHPSVSRWFTNYAAYYAANTALFVCVIIGLEWMLRRWFQPVAKLDGAPS